MGAHSLASLANITRQHTATGARRKGLRIRVQPHDAIGPLVVVGHSECDQLNAAFHKNKSCSMLSGSAVFCGQLGALPNPGYCEQPWLLELTFGTMERRGGGGGAGVTGSFSSVTASETRHRYPRYYSCRVVIHLGSNAIPPARVYLHRAWYYCRNDTLCGAARSLAGSLLLFFRVCLVVFVF